MYEIAEELQEALLNYLRWVQRAHRDVVIRGIHAGGSKAALLPLSATYVSLSAASAGRTVTGSSLESVLDGFILDPIDFSALAPGARADDPIREPQERTAVVPVESVVGVGPTSVITGGPGSGKTTVLQYIALTLATSALDLHNDVARRRLGIIGELPVPVYVPLNRFARFSNDRSPEASPRDFTLLKFAENYVIMRQACLDLPDDFFAKLLHRGVSLVLLLDGLDEVADEDERVHISRTIQDISQSPLPCSIVVTSRPASYYGNAVLPPYFREFEIRDLSRETVNMMIRGMCEALYPDAEECTRNTATIVQSVSLLEEHRRTLGIGAERLIVNPLMVRMLITLHLSGRRIAEQRAELFGEYVDALLLATYHPDAMVASRLAVAAGPSPVQRALLCRLAFDLHDRGSAGRPTMTAEQLHGFVATQLGESLGVDEALEFANRFVEATRQRGGLLEAEGMHYRFSHLAFQEFLVARYLAENLRTPEAIAGFLESQARVLQSWWREPILLCIGYIMNTSPDTARRLVRLLAGLDREQLAEPAVDLTELELAGHACAEWQLGAGLRDEVAERINEAVLGDPGGAGGLRLRAALGAVLGVLGDPRPGLRSEAPEVIDVPAGSFFMGHPGDHGPVNLPSMQTGVYRVWTDKFRIGRYPVVNAQYARFVEAGGYRDDAREMWTAAGWEWKQAYAVTSPAYWCDAVWTTANHPVVGVSWYEAVAYCCWLSRHTGRRFCLPSEADWERAARGNDARAWPWGETWSAGLANTLEAGLGRTSCVGLFIQSVSPLGLSDCAGNVWEWCSSQFQGYARYQAVAGREDIDGSVPRVLRGGSWLNGRDHARVANRDHYAPGDRHFDLGFRIKEVA